VNAKILDIAALRDAREQLRADGKVVVQCHGCFDIVHPGHVRYLQHARSLGDVLIVSVSSDDVVGKGYDRPYINERLRAENLAALVCVDFVVIDPHAWAGPVLEDVRPDVYVKGKEYEHKSDPRFAREKSLVESYGGRVVFSSGDVVFSSTAILGKYRQAFALEGEKIRFFCERHQIDRRSVEAALGKLAGRRVVVLGDAILDRYIHSESAKVAAEGPILSVRPFEEEVFVGGAGLIAGQMAALGADVVFITAAGDGPHAETVESVLARAGVRTERVAVDPRPVFVKTRYCVEGNKVFKVDEGSYGPPSSVAGEQIVDALAREVADRDGLVVTDFGYGLFSAVVIDGVQRVAAETGRPYYADVSTSGQANILKFRGCRLATPTEAELRLALADHESGLAPLAARYYAQSGAESLVLTLGKRGALWFARPEPGDERLHTDYLPALGVKAVDAVGAGDVFLSVMVLGDLSGVPVGMSMYLASAVAAIHVGRLGNDPVDAMDLRRFLDQRPELAPGP
jgi:rfaE bifunctional protein kinase chain/domain/rfaE bifunctional protein nucleotidyltransferase chain/domain